MTSQDVIEAEFGFTQKTGRPHGIEDSVGTEMMAIVQEMEVIIRRVQNQFVTVECLPQRFQMNIREGIHQLDFAGYRQLQQAHFFRVRVQAIRFSINAYPRSSGHPCGKFPEFRASFNHRD